MTEADSATDFDVLRQVWRYDPDTGDFYWLISTHCYGGKVSPGDKAGWIRPDGRAMLCFGNKEYRAHRVAWLFMTGEWPPHHSLMQVEHRDGDLANNRWNNLGLVTQAKNKQNLNDKLQNNNKSGYRGVWLLPSGSWQAYIKVNKRQIRLGCYAELKDAIAARKVAERCYFGADRLRPTDIAPVALRCPPNAGNRNKISRLVTSIHLELCATAGRPDMAEASMDADNRS